MVVKSPATRLEYDEAIKSETLTVVDWYADWCGPCKVLGPVLSDLSEQADLISAGVTFIKMNVDVFQELAVMNEITAMPTIQFYKAGKVLETQVGAAVNKITSHIQALK